jgi:hypothetical protein
MIQPVHELPRRLRFSVPHLRGDRRRAVALRARLRLLDGVTAVDPNPVTGSLIVHHDGGPETRERILRNLAEFTRAAAPRRVEPLPRPATAVAPARPDDRIAEAIADALAQRLAEHLARMASERLLRLAIAALI